MLKRTAFRLALGTALALCLTAATRVVFAQSPASSALETLLATKACERCDLSGTAFSKEMDLRSADLTGAKLVGASFYRVDLTTANFTDADLSKANLTMTNLTNANFGGANLDGANLTGSTGASLAGVKTTEATVCPDGQAGPCR